MPAARTGGETAARGRARIFLRKIFGLDIRRRVVRSNSASLDSYFAVCLRAGINDKNLTYIEIFRRRCQ